MAKRVQLIRHNEAQANAFIGREGELTVDLTNKEVRVHDSVTAGGIRTARRDLANVAAATAGNDGKMTATQVGQLTTVIANLVQEIIDRVNDVNAEELRATTAEGVLQTDINNEAIARANADALLIPLTQKAQANGVATLNTSSRVVQIPELLNGLTASVAALNLLTSYPTALPRFATAQSWTAAQTFPAATVADGATINWDTATQQVGHVVLGGTGRTLANPTNMVDGKTVILLVSQDAIGGRTITGYGSAYIFADGVAPIWPAYSHDTVVISGVIRTINGVQRVLCTWSSFAS